MQALSAQPERLRRERSIASGLSERIQDPSPLDCFNRRPDHALKGYIAGCIGRNRLGRHFTESRGPQCHVAKDEADKVRLAYPVASGRNLDFRARVEFALERGFHGADTPVTFDEIQNDRDSGARSRQPALDVLAYDRAFGADLNEVQKRVV